MKKVFAQLGNVILGSPAHRLNLTSYTLPRRQALALFGADGISSVAYAPDEIILMLAVAGTAGLVYSFWVALGIALILVLVVATYRYNIAHIAQQGDFLLVDRRLGPGAGMTLGAASMLDFLLTLAVSTAAAAGYLLAVFPELTGYERPVAMLLLVLVALLSLRGLKLMGKLAQLPTYVFLTLLLVMVLIAMISQQQGQLPRAQSSSYTLAPLASFEDSLTGLGLLMLLARAFSSGAVALTGVSAMSNSVRFFRQPQKAKASSTLIASGLISAALLLAVVYLVTATGAQMAWDPQRQLLVAGEPVGKDFFQKPLLYQVAETVFADPLLPALLALATVGVLLMAAVNACLGFPVLTSTIAERGYLPTQMSARRSVRLYGGSILLLTCAAMLLLLVYGSNVNALIQLYIVGVFTSMLLTQSAVARYRQRQLRLTLDWNKRRTIIRDLLVTWLGLAATFLSLSIVVVTKFSQGAWLSVLLIVLTVMLMRTVEEHYRQVDRDLELEMTDEALAAARRLPPRVHAVVYVPRVRKPVVRALAYARASRPSSIETVAVNVLAEETKQTISRWEKLGVPVGLTVLDAPYRDGVTPFIDYIRRKKAAAPRDLLVIYLPEYVVKHWWSQLLHRRTVHRMAGRLRREPGVMLASVPWYLGQEETDLGKQEVQRERGNG